jgi:hypothetical protein
MGNRFSIRKGVRVVWRRERRVATQWPQGRPEFLTAAAAAALYQLDCPAFMPPTSGFDSLGEIGLILEQNPFSLTHIRCFWSSCCIPLR